MEHHTAPMTPAEAWQDFWENHRPTIWKDLSVKTKRDLYTANYAASGRDKYGLGMDRMARIFNDLAPGRYVVETKTVIYLAEKS